MSFLYLHTTNVRIFIATRHQRRENILHGIFYFKQYLQFGAVMHIPFFGRMVYLIIHEQPTVVHFELIVSYCLEDF